jgi:hypothetical protein
MRTASEASLARRQRWPFGFAQDKQATALHMSRSLTLLGGSQTRPYSADNHLTWRAAFEFVKALFEFF